MNDESLVQQIAVDLEQLKSKIAAINNLSVSDHSSEFEKVHQLLQQALSNLDGV
jgi:hypothetical protein